jgi:uncharacterized protein YfaS (alpha-2-macroglobulin family)
VGAGEALYYTQLPFSLSVKVPPVFVTGDQPTLALTLKNTTDKELTGTLIVKIPEGMKAAGTIPRTVTVPARGARVTRIPLIVETPSEKSEFAASFETLGRTDAFAQPVKIVPQGFPVNMSFLRPGEGPNVPGDPLRSDPPFHPGAFQRLSDGRLRHPLRR